MNKITLRSVAAALALTFSLTACASAPTTAVSTAADSAASGAEATPSVNAAYLDFDYSGGITDTGYWDGVTAADYVTLPENWESLPIPADVSAVSAEDVQATLDSMMAEYETSDSVTDRAVVKDDVVNIDYVGSVDGVEFSGGSTGGNGTDVTAGGNQYVDDFLTQLIGHKPGETFDVVVTFPDGYADSTDADGNPLVLANKDVTFVTTINYITETNTPELTDAFVVENFADTYSDVSTVDELKQAISDDLQHSSEYSYVLEQLAQNSTFADELPVTLMEYQKGGMLNYYATYADYYGSTLDEFVSGNLGADNVDALVEQMQDSFTSSVKQFLVLQAIAEKAGIIADDQQVDDYFQDTDYTDYADFYGKNYLRLNVLGSLAMQHVLDHAARGTEPAASEAASAAQ